MVTVEQRAEAIIIEWSEAVPGGVRPPYVATLSRLIVKAIREARAEAVEQCAQLCEAVRMRDWTAEECARQIRDHEKHGRLGKP